MMLYSTLAFVLLFHSANCVVASSPNFFIQHKYDGANCTNLLSTSEHVVEAVPLDVCVNGYIHTVGSEEGIINQKNYGAFDDPTCSGDPIADRERNITVGECWLSGTLIAEAINEFGVSETYPYGIQLFSTTDCSEGTPDSRRMQLLDSSDDLDSCKYSDTFGTLWRIEADETKLVVKLLNSCDGDGTDIKGTLSIPFSPNGACLDASVLGHNFYKGIKVSNINFTQAENPQDSGAVNTYTANSLGLALFVLGFVSIAI